LENVRTEAMGVEGTFLDSLEDCPGVV